MQSLRAIGFKPPTDEHEWELTLPHPHTLIEQAGFAEGLLAVQIAANTSSDGSAVYTDDAFELRVAIIRPSNMLS